VEILVEELGTAAGKLPTALGQAVETRFFEESVDSRLRCDMMIE
jgi:hypothetical protein